MENKKIKVVLEKTPDWFQIMDTKEGEDIILEVVEPGFQGTLVYKPTSDTLLMDGTRYQIYRLVTPNS